MPKKKPKLAVERVAEYAKGKTKEELEARLKELAPLMPSEDDAVFTEYFDCLEALR